MFEKLYRVEFEDDFMLVKGQSVALGYIKKQIYFNGLITSYTKFALIR